MPRTRTPVPNAEDFKKAGLGLSMLEGHRVSQLRKHDGFRVKKCLCSKGFAFRVSGFGALSLCWLKVAASLGCQSYWSMLTLLYSCSRMVVARPLSFVLATLLLGVQLFCVDWLQAQSQKSKEDFKVRPHQYRNFIMEAPASTGTSCRAKATFWAARPISKRKAYGVDAGFWGFLGLGAAGGLC